MYVMSKECRVPVFSNKVTLKDTDKEAGKIIDHINLYETLNIPKFGIMANHKNVNKLESERWSDNFNKSVIYNF